MKKIFIGVAIVAAGIVLSGCESKTALQQDESQQVTQVEVIQEKIKPIGSAVSSLKSVMGLNKKMKCSYSGNVGASEPDSIVYIEGKKFKAAETIDGIAANALFDGDAVYFWPKEGKEGHKFTKNCINELKVLEPSTRMPEDRFVDAGNISCESSTDNIDFSAPSPVTFVDDCENAKERLKNKPVPNTIPVEDNESISSVPAQ